MQSESDESNEFFDIEADQARLTDPRGKFIFAVFGDLGFAYDGETIYFGLLSKINGEGMAPIRRKYDMKYRNKNRDKLNAKDKAYRVKRRISRNMLLKTFRP